MESPATVAACRREFVAVARSFWLIPELIPQPSRDDVALLYCLCRRLDDSVDEAPSRAAGTAALAQWRAELFGKSTPRPLVAAFLSAAARNGVPLGCLELLLQGMEQDLGDVALPDDAALLRYAYRVSSAVGLMLAPLLGMRSKAAEARVVDLGLALQLTNVLLGVGADAKKGRVYLPATRLAAVGLAPRDVLERPEDPRLRRALEGLAALADRYYDSAAEGAALVPLRYRHGVLLLGRAYRELGWRAARGERPLTTPSQLPQRVHARELVSLAATAWHPRTLGLLPAPAHDPSLHHCVADLFPRRPSTA